MTEAAIFDALEAAAKARSRKFWLWLDTNDTAIQRAIRRVSVTVTHPVDPSDPVGVVLARLRVAAVERWATGDVRRNEQTVKAFREAGAAESIVATGGYRLIVQHMGGVLISVVPKAQSARPQFGGVAGVVIWPHGEERMGQRSFGGRRYSVPSFGWPQRAKEACILAAEAFIRAGGDLRLFYEALGALGQCAICGATLTDELSKARGIGPECVKKIEAGVYRAMLDEEREAAVERARR